MANVELAKQIDPPPAAVYLTTSKPMKLNKMEDAQEVKVKTMKTSSGKVRKRQSNQTKRRKLRGTVVKMLAVMESNPESKDPAMEFLVTGRTGRRNAMADILGPNATVTSKDLPERLQSLSTTDKDPSTSKATTGTQESQDGKGMDATGSQAKGESADVPQSESKS